MLGLGEGHQLTLDGSRPSSARAALEAEAVRFFAKVVADPRPGGCQHWIGAIGDDGYGRFQAGTGPDARTARAHRWNFEYACGLRPLHRPLLHSCDETGCVAVEHLVVGTAAENAAAMHRRGRGWRRHTARTDLRGPAGRARAIRAALRDGWDLAAFTTAVAAGDPFTDQLVLPVVHPRAESSSPGRVRSPSSGCRRQLGPGTRRQSQPGVALRDCRWTAARPAAEGYPATVLPPVVGRVAASRRRTDEPGAAIDTGRVRER